MPVLSSERTFYMKKEEIVRQRKIKSDHGPQSGAQHQDELAGWSSVAKSTLLILPYTYSIEQIGKDYTLDRKRSHDWRT
jgi:hypothetical protein